MEPQYPRWARREVEPAATKIPFGKCPDGLLSAAPKGQRRGNIVGVVDLATARAHRFGLADRSDCRAVEPPGAPLDRVTEAAASFTPDQRKRVTTDAGLMVEPGARTRSGHCDRKRSSP